ncbi:E5 protein [Mustela putorius papillomavirus 1]|uniref:E5 protein n=1 Tax=Mustela putorius papillomavirus 1 TaxID=2259540 RepID=T1YCE4_9PAPI|nr:E5 protein [Mustela putorius papillomavirus 1]AGU62956.1 E5 protein [Mustela putorius papillomavirus 1]
MLTCIISTFIITCISCNCCTVVLYCFFLDFFTFIKNNRTHAEHIAALQHTNLLTLLTPLLLLRWHPGQSGLKETRPQTCTSTVWLAEIVFQTWSINMKTKHLLTKFFRLGEVLFIWEGWELARARELGVQLGTDHWEGGVQTL